MPLPTRTMVGVGVHLSADDLHMLRGRCLPANGPAAREQLHIIDREIDRLRRASPAFHRTTHGQVRRPTTAVNSTPKDPTPYWALIREPVGSAPFAGLRRTRPVNGPSKLQLRVNASLKKLYNEHASQMNEEIASSPPRPARSSLTTPSASCYPPSSSSSLLRPHSASALSLVPLGMMSLEEGPWPGSAAELQAAAARRLAAQQAEQANEHGLRLQAVGVLTHGKGGNDDERGLDWRQKRALRNRKKRASQRALLHGDDDDAADNIGWHHKALAMTRNAQSSTLLPTGSSWSGKLEPPPMLPQFIHGKPRRPMTTSPSKERPGSRG